MRRVRAGCVRHGEDERKDLQAEAIISECLPWLREGEEMSLFRIVREVSFACDDVSRIESRLKDKATKNFVEEERRCIIRFWLECLYFITF